MRPRLLEPFSGEGGSGLGYNRAGFDYGGARRNKWEARHVRKGGYVPPSLDVLRALIGAPWMTEKGCFLAVPPAYTQHIGAQLMAHLNLMERAS